MSLKYFLGVEGSSKGRGDGDVVLFWRWAPEHPCAKRDHARKALPPLCRAWGTELSVRHREGRKTLKGLNTQSAPLWPWRAEPRGAPARWGGALGWLRRARPPGTGAGPGRQAQGLPASRQPPCLGAKPTSISHEIQLQRYFFWTPWITHWDRLCLYAAGLQE